MAPRDDDGDDPNFGAGWNAFVFPGFVDDVHAGTPTVSGAPTLIDPRIGNVYASTGITKPVWVPSAVSVRPNTVDIFKNNIPEKQQAAMVASVKAMLDFMKVNSPTFASALKQQLENPQHGLAIVPVDGTGGGMAPGRSLVIGTSAGVRDDGSIIYPAYVLAHELGHHAQATGTRNPEWDLPNTAFGYDDNGNFLPSRKIAPNSAEYYAYQFAQQVAEEIRQATGVDIGNLKNYWDVGTTNKNLGLMPTPTPPPSPPND
jgi:hypothetical protein